MNKKKLESIAPSASSASLILTSEQKAADFNNRLALFQSELRGILGKYNLAMKAQITPDGPVINVTSVSA